MKKKIVIVLAVILGLVIFSNMGLTKREALQQGMGCYYKGQKAHFHTFNNTVLYVTCDVIK